MSDDAILLVEDNRFDEILTLRMLGKCNFRDVVVARDGAEAFDYLTGEGAYEGRDISRTPRFMLLDLKMPKIDGIELLRMIRAHDRLRRIPVIVITSSIEERDVVQCNELEVLSYLNKPVTMEALTDALKKHGIFAPPFRHKEQLAEE